MSELCDLTAIEQRRLLMTGETSAVELLDSHLARIDERNPTLNAVVSLDPSVGRRHAEAVDATIAKGDDPGPLAGLVTANKDLTETADFPTTYGSPVFAEFEPGVDAILASRMKAAGAVPVGKTNTPEFGAGSNTFNPVHGATANAFDPTKTCGGSSGGAAVALATNMVAVADGSDFGGSLRNPAAWSNVVGFRPSLGVVPNGGAGSAWPALGIAGPMARNVDDLAMLFDVLAAPEVTDPLSRGMSIPSPVTPVDRPLRVAWSDTLGGLPVEDDVLATLHALRDHLQDDVGWEIVEAEPDLADADECFHALRAWTFSTDALLSSLAPDQRAALKETVQLEITEGEAMSAADVSRGLRQLKSLWRRCVSFFGDYDLMIAPVTQVSPFPLEQEYPTSVAGVEMERYTQWMMSCCRITVTGMPAMSLPAGFTDDGLPVGAQLIGGPWGDVDLLRAAKTIESSRG